MGVGRIAKNETEELRLRVEQLEKQLRAREREIRELSTGRTQFLAIIRHAGVGFFVVDREHRVIWANDAFRDRFLHQEVGTRPFVGMACNRVLCGRPEVCNDCPVPRCFRTGKSAHHELRLWIRDRFHSVYVIAIPIVNEENTRPQQVMLMLLDVTDLQAMRKSDQAFLTSEQRFRSVFENSPVGTATLKLDGSFLQVNPSLCRMLGYTESGFLWKKLDDVVHSEDRDLRPLRIQEAAPGGLRADKVERRYVRRDGTVLWGKTTTLVQLDAEERPVYTIVLIEDVTERRRAAQELEQVRQHHDDLVGSIDGIVWEADPATLRFTSVRGRTEEILGFSPDRWLTQPRFWRNRIHPEDLDRVTGILSLAGTARDRFELEYRMIAADGRTVWIRDRVGFVEGPDGGVRMQGVMTDITEFRSSGAESADSLFRLAGAIAGDLDCLLASIRDDTQRLIDGIAGDDPRKEVVEAISRSVNGASGSAARLREAMEFARQERLEAEGSRQR
jgi:PAS domain S-box-containing protein